MHKEFIIIKDNQFAEFRDTTFLDSLYNLTKQQSFFHLGSCTLQSVNPLLIIALIVCVCVWPLLVVQCEAPYIVFFKILLMRKRDLFDFFDCLPGVF